MRGFQLSSRVPAAPHPANTHASPAGRRIDGTLLHHFRQDPADGLPVEDFRREHPGSDAFLNPRKAASQAFDRQKAVRIDPMDQSAVAPICS